MEKVELFRTIKGFSTEKKRKTNKKQGIVTAVCSYLSSRYKYRGFVLCATSVLVIHTYCLEIGYALLVPPYAGTADIALKLGTCILLIEEFYTLLHLGIVGIDLYCRVD